MDSAAQILAKQANLADILVRIGKVTPQHWLAPLTAGAWGYRRKARLGVRYVAKKGKVLVGFRERNNAFIADLSRCEVLHPAVGDTLTEIGRAIGALSIRDQIPQVEVAMGETPPALVFRTLAPPSAIDITTLSELGERAGFHIYLQDGGPDTIRPLPGHGLDLHYTLPSQGVRIEFEPTDFTQVNLELNRLMVDRALALLEVEGTDRVLDLFCGVGNFTLPLARLAGSVVGVEGDSGLVARAQSNAALNAIGNVRFYTANLDASFDGEPWARESFDKALLDPPRSGGLGVLDLLPRLGVRRVLYVSCYPSTLARDADHLVNALGYRLVSAGVMDMFPQTAHVESMALFERG
jgi:23S rRNA (uracil1939-C5)-methyltransferase